MLRRHLPDLPAPIASLVEDGVYTIYEVHDRSSLPYVLATDAGALYAVSASGAVTPTAVSDMLTDLNIDDFVLPAPSPADPKSSP